MNIRLIVNIMRRILRIEAFCILPAAVIALVRMEMPAFWGFTLTAALIAVLDALAHRLFHPRDHKIYAKEGFVSVALAWVVISVFGAVPFYVSGSVKSAADALFESVSGFTTTGSSVLQGTPPLSILYWRGFSQWLGGMGVLVFMMALLPMSQSGGSFFHVLRAESPGPAVGKLMPRIRQNARILYTIYIALTAVMAVFLLAGGMPLFESLMTAFATAGTGGFSAVNTMTLGNYHQIVIGVFMALFGVNFTMYYYLLTRQFRAVSGDEELKWYGAILLCSTIIMTANILPLYGNILTALKHGFFQTASILTSTAMASANYDLWPQLSRCIILLLMILGACAGSTSGGIKIARAIILLKGARGQMQKLMHPRSVKALRVNEKRLSDQVITGANVFMLAYFIIAAVSVVLLSLSNFSLETSITSVIAMLGNVGPGLGEVVGPMGGYSQFSVFGKFVLMLDMLFGRLEIFPMLLLFAPSMWKKSE